jgi:hypothetical protein
MIIYIIPSVLLYVVMIAVTLGVFKYKDFIKDSESEVFLSILWPLPFIVFMVYMTFKYPVLLIYKTSLLVEQCLENRGAKK